MQIGFAKILRKWFLSIDHVLLFSVFALVAIGTWVSIASTPALAMRLGFYPFHFVKMHLIVVPLALCLMIFISFLQAKHLRKLSVIGYFVCVILIICTLFWGAEIKGARRWINLFGLSLQPSELLKPTMPVITAWLISEQYRDRKFPGILLAILALFLVVPLILLQPDIGMTVILGGTFFAQMFISGLSVFMIIALAVSSVSALFGFYVIFPHFADRIDKFLMKSASADVYQIKKSIEAFKSGGFFGKGPGEGVVKTFVPDSHSDFVFSVIGEEYGFVLCFLIVALFATFVTRAILKVMQSSNIFTLTTIYGIVFQIATQVLINICTSLNLIPTKGMTLPFISYGGSSMIASAISFGIVLALTKKNILSREVL